MMETKQWPADVVTYSERRAYQAGYQAALASEPSDAMDALRRACAKILHEDPELWPRHGDAPRAIAAAMSLLAMTVRNLGDSSPQGAVREDGPLRS